MPTSIEKLYLFQVATLIRPPMNTPVLCYLVQTNDGKNILIDSGLPEHLEVPPGFPTLHLRQNVIEQLALLDLQPQDIHMLVCTHFDTDHAGRHTTFSQAEMVIQRSHYEHGLSQPRFAATRAQWDHAGARYRFVDGDCELLPGLELIATDGHCRGHQSVLARLPQTGPVLLAIDAVPTEKDFTPVRQASSVDENEEQLRASTQKLLALVQREQIALVIFGHDDQQWQKLKKAPAYYG